MVRSKHRGHDIEEACGFWVYTDTKQRVIDNKNRECGHCGMPDREDDHDPCFGKLPGLMNACCGHGIKAEAYVQFMDGFCIRGLDAFIVAKALKRARDEK